MLFKTLIKLIFQRYESYIEFLEDAKLYKTKVTYEGIKEESSVKPIIIKKLQKLAAKNVLTQEKN